MCICFFAFKIESICFSIVGKILNFPKLCNFDHKFLQHLTKMLSKKLISQEPLDFVVVS